MVTPLKTSSPKPFLLAADIDGTLLGDEQGEADFRAQRRRDPDAFRLAYVTGRYLHSVRDLVAEGRLPAPDFVCVNVGTEIFAWNDPGNAIGRKYAARIVPGWDLEAIYTAGVGEGIWLQDFGADQPPYQAGFSWDGRPESLAAMRLRLANGDRYRILPSYGEFVDVLPAGFGKGDAVRFLQQEIGLPPDRVVVAGDAGNDVEMFATGFRGIVPTNALDELKTAARQPWHYHSPLPAGRGVLDGLRHFGFIEEAA